MGCRRVNRGKIKTTKTQCDLKGSNTKKRLVKKVFSFLSKGREKGEKERGQGGEVSVQS